MLQLAPGPPATGSPFPPRYRSAGRGFDSSGVGRPAAPMGVTVVERETNTSQDQAAEALFQGIFARADRKLAKKLRREGQGKRAAQANRRAARRVRSVKDRSRVGGGITRPSPHRPERARLTHSVPHMAGSLKRKAERSWGAGRVAVARGTAAAVPAFCPSSGAICGCDAIAISSISA